MPCKKKKIVCLLNLLYTQIHLQHIIKKKKNSMFIWIDHKGASVPIKVCSTTCLDGISTNAIASGTLQPDHDCLITENAEIRYT